MGLALSRLLGSWWTMTTTAPTRPLVILDLNGLLVFRAFAHRIAEEHPDLVELTSRATLLGQHYTWTRPSAKWFLRELFERYEIAVWSSAWAKNVDLLCAHVFGEDRSRLLFEWDQSRCVEIKPHPDPERAAEGRSLYRKDIAQVWAQYPQYNASNIFIIDDDPFKMTENPPQCYLLTRPWHPLVTPVTMCKGPWHTSSSEDADTQPPPDDKPIGCLGCTLYEIKRRLRSSHHPGLPEL